MHYRHNISLNMFLYNWPMYYPQENQTVFQSIKQEPVDGVGMIEPVSAEFPLNGELVEVSLISFFFLCLHA